MVKITNWLCCMKKSRYHACGKNSKIALVSSYSKLHVLLHTYFWHKQNDNLQTIKSVYIKLFLKCNDSSQYTENYSKNNIYLKISKSSVNSKHSFKLFIKLKEIKMSNVVNHPHMHVECS